MNANAQNLVFCAAAWMHRIQLSMVPMMTFESISLNDLPVPPTSQCARVSFISICTAIIFINHTNVQCERVCSHTRTHSQASRRETSSCGNRLEIQRKIITKQRIPYSHRSFLLSFELCHRLVVSRLANSKIRRASECDAFN